MTGMTNNSQERSNLPTLGARMGDRVNQIINGYVYEGKHTLEEVETLVQRIPQAIKEDLATLP